MKYHTNTNASALKPPLSHTDGAVFCKPSKKWWEQRRHGEQVAKRCKPCGMPERNHGAIHLSEGNVSYSTKLVDFYIYIYIYIYNILHHARQELIISCSLLAMLNNRRSSQYCAISCMPTGRRLCSGHIGTLTAGRPAKLAGTVKTSFV